MQKLLDALKPYSPIILYRTQRVYNGIAAIIDARGLSSAASAANAAIDHMRDWALGTHGAWVTMGIPSQGWYGIPKDVMFGFPVTCENGEYKVVEGLDIDAFSKQCRAVPHHSYRRVSGGII